MIKINYYIFKKNSIKKKYNNINFNIKKPSYRTNGLKQKLRDINFGQHKLT